MNRNLGDIRRSQVITNFGPGAIIDFRVGKTPVSVIAAGIDNWPGTYGSVAAWVSNQIVSEPRLQKMLNVDFFRLPPVDARPFYMKQNEEDKGPKLVGVRFPRWLQCPKCHVVQPDAKWSIDDDGWMCYCSGCSETRKREYVVPVRFMCACENGHIQDFPWWSWAEHRDGCSKEGKLKLVTDGKSSGLSGLLLVCDECNQSVGMQSAFVQDQFRGRFKCRGHKPWINEKDENCSAELRAVQRGASNLYFPVIKSALDIPPWCDNFVKSFGEHWNKFANEEDDARLDQGLEWHDMEKKLGMNKDEIKKKIKILKEKMNNISQETILIEEYEQFTSQSLGIETVKDFETVNENVPLELANWVQKIVGIKRLREVRALTGFTRIFATGDEQAGDSERIANIYLNRQNWLPAIEVRGEGIFIELNKKKIEEWNKNPTMLNRARNLKERYDNEINQRSGGTVTEGNLEITPKMLLIHSLSHALIKNLAILCGYSSASLRERLYYDEEMSGILIYTASSDSDGTLGGLVRQAKENSFYKLFMRSINDMKWCSSDPICINSLKTISDTLNNSACHSCLFLSETSCVHFNRFLDRAALIGDPSDKDSNFFNGLEEL